MARRGAPKEPQRARRSARPSAEARRRELTLHATRILSERGLEALHVTALAESAGVSRPLVYRVFPTREALFRAVLEDFAADVGARFQAALARAETGTVDAITRAFVEASCDAIEAKGAAPWALLDPRGVSPELGRIAADIFGRMLDPWKERLGEFLGVAPRRAANHLGIVVAAGRAALTGWLDGTLTREEAASDATAAVTGLLGSFASSAESERARRRRR